ncbi:hypothetical protein NA57DRAFT_80482 [Rhizodiscina lignyota]|uniref:STEEP1 domain-containing protein n=1 Tax=Rhizodiscina lignyota TaxID=1504668 RepID=A0A9P4M0X9_9PEZI|nr:hypothetical protein NA57DRAFT_80482 [Rhizodiscina lignyota]
MGDQLPKTPPSLAPGIRTYHCICSNLVLASTRPQPSLARRKVGNDRAYILPLPPLPDSEDDIDMEHDPVAKDKAGEVGLATSKSTKSSGYALLLSTYIDRKPVLIRRAESFEKRYLHRCGRCGLIFGYQLDWAQYDQSSQGKGQDSEGATATHSSDRREDVIYLIPGGLQSTQSMMEADVESET